MVRPQVSLTRPARANTPHAALVVRIHRAHPPGPPRWNTGGMTSGHRPSRSAEAARRAAAAGARARQLARRRRDLSEPAQRVPNEPVEDARRALRASRRRAALAKGRLLRAYRQAALAHQHAAALHGRLAADGQARVSEHRLAEAWHRRAAAADRARLVGTRAPTSDDVAGRRPDGAQPLASMPRELATGRPRRRAESATYLADAGPLSGGAC